MRPEQLSWDDLRIFMHVAHCGNFSKAGKQLKVDQSTVSRRINQLEYTLGFSLFERSVGGIQLNENGERLLLSVERMGSGFTNLLEALDNGTNEVSGKVRVGTMEGLASLYITQQLPKLQLFHPTLEIELITATQPLQVTRREADIFLGFFEPSGHGFDSECLGAFQLFLYAAPAYLERMGEPTPETLHTHDFVGYIDELIHIDAVRWLDDVIQSPRQVFHSNSMLAQMFAASAGMGLVMLPAFSHAERFGLQKVMPQLSPPTRKLWLTVHHDLRYIPRIKLITEFLQRTFRNDEWFQHA